MDRGNEQTPASSASSTEISHRDRPTAILLRLRVAEAARPPPQVVLPPAPATTADPLLSSASHAYDPSHSDSPQNEVSGSVDLWGEFLPADLIRQVALCLRSSRTDVERMRSVCPVWRDAVPSTVDPIFVLSRKTPEVDSELIVMKIKKGNYPNDVSFEVKLPSSPPPFGVSCWGSALGLMALQCHSPDSRRILVYCMCCGLSKDILSLPMGMIPRALYLEPLTPERFVLMAEGESRDSTDGKLYIDSHGFEWPMEGGPWWLQAPGFGDTPLRSMLLDPGVVRAGADREKIIIIDEAGRPINDEAEILQIQLPPIFLPDGTITSPWMVNGQHLFLCCGKMYLLQIYDSPQTLEKVAVRLLGIEKVQDEYVVTPLDDIGNYSVFLGPNQSFVLPCLDSVVGRMPNTIYVEDYRGSIRHPQALAINIQTISTVVIPFPEEVTSKLKDTLPGVWVGLPQKHDLFNHCRGDNGWRFWD